MAPTPTCFQIDLPWRFPPEIPLLYLTSNRWPSPNVSLWNNVDSAVHIMWKQFTFNSINNQQDLQCMHEYVQHAFVFQKKRVVAMYPYDGVSSGDLVLETVSCSAVTCKYCLVIHLVSTTLCDRINFAVNSHCAVPSCRYLHPGSNPMLYQ